MAWLQGIGQTWKRFVGWFRRAILPARIGVGCGALVIVCCVCSGGIVALANTPYGQQLAQQTEATETAQTIADAQATASAQAYALTHPTATSAATNTPAPTSTLATATTPATGAPTSTVPALATATPTGPKPSPTPTTPKPTPTPVVLKISITCASATDNVSGKVCIHTQPGATVAITVTYCSGKVATSASLQGTRTANSSGNYTWTWTPETTCHGTATADVTSSWHGQFAEAFKDFDVA